MKKKIRENFRFLIECKKNVRFEVKVHFWETVHLKNHFSIIMKDKMFFRGKELSTFYFKISYNYAIYR